MVYKTIINLQVIMITKKRYDTAKVLFFLYEFSVIIKSHLILHGSLLSKKKKSFFVKIEDKNEGYVASFQIDLKYRLLKSIFM